jgi:protein-tyrosine phosphatase
MSVGVGSAAWRALLFALPVLGGCATTPDSQKPIPFTAATVTSADGHQFSISWRMPAAQSVTVYAGTDANKIDRGQPLGKGGADGSVSVTEPPAARWYFELVPDHGGPLTIADRSLHLATAPNFRDAGGYRTEDGHWVRMGLLYRSDQLDHLSPADLDTLHADGIHLVCDLRTDAERAQGIDKLPMGAEPLIADVAGNDSASSGLAKLFAGGGDPQALLGNGRGAQLMADANRQFVSSPSALKAYHALFERLADPKMLPAVVPRDTIMRDYLLSNDTLKAKNDRMLAALKGRIDPELLRPLMDVRPDYLDAAFDEVTKTYGTMDRYLHDGLGLDDATLAQLRHEFLVGGKA